MSKPERKPIGKRDLWQILAEMTKAEQRDYERRVRAYEEQEITRSDAQGIVDAELLTEERAKVDGYARDIARSLRSSPQSFRYLDDNAPDYRGAIVDECGAVVVRAVNQKQHGKLLAAAPKLLAALHKINANAAESVEWMRRVTSEAIAEVEGGA